MSPAGTLKLAGLRLAPALHMRPAMTTTTTTLAPLFAALSCSLFAACAEPGLEEVGLDPAEASADLDGKSDGAVSQQPDVRCTTAPTTGSATRWRHTSSAAIAIATPNHRGFDLIASSADATQVIAGEVSYGLADKALEDEKVELFACRAGAWKLVGSARTDDEGGFRVALTGANRLPVGLRDMYVSVQGDRSGARFLALVATAGTKLVVSDVDGTLTSSENAFPEALVTDTSVAVHPGAPAAFNQLALRGYQPIYVTARGDLFTGATRGWLTAVGMPRGPMRLAPHRITLPGSPTVAFKSGVLDELEAAGLDVAVGIGNRGSDIEAYTHAGVAPGSILIKLPEFRGEVAEALTAQRAVGFASYGDLAPLIAALR